MISIVEENGEHTLNFTIHLQAAIIFKWTFKVYKILFFRLAH